MEKVIDSVNRNPLSSTKTQDLFDPSLVKSGVKEVVLRKNLEMYAKPKQMVRGYMKTQIKGETQDPVEIYSNKISRNNSQGEIRELKTANNL